MPTVIYLHGFASSPNSTKATLFREPLEARGARYLVPDLNVPSFEQLSLSAMLKRVAETVNTCPPDDEIFLVGSSMGGLTAVHFYDRYRHKEALRVSKMVLLAPAFDFMANRDRQMGSDWRERWREAGAMPFFNYATNGDVPVHYGLIEDVAQYDSYGVTLDIPVLIYHGKDDESVNFEQSVHFAESRPNVTLHLMHADHQLLDKTDEILAGMMIFFGL